MRVADLRYELPEELIAQRPPARRRDARLLALEAASGVMRDLHITDLPALLAPGDLLVLNDTRVVPARLAARKASGGRVEVLLERALSARRMLALVRASKGPRVGTELVFAGGERARVVARRGAFWELELGSGTVTALLEAEGTVPLPPYIRRAPEPADRERYQTVYARRDGAVAAPTAGLHLDAELLAELAARGIGQVYVTLHVGAGTFQPLRSEHLEDHEMHAERLEVGEAACQRIAEARRAGGRVVAVGTTTVRALEAASAGGELRPLAGETRLFIRPGHRFRCVDALLTNFHLPGSTLLALVCAFAGVEPVLAAYRHAVAERYRFFSYGDAMFLTRAGR